MSKKFDVSATGKEFNGQLELTFNSGKYKGVTWIYGGIAFDEEENDDGKIGMKFDYEITGEQHPKNVTEFINLIGDVLVDIMLEQMERKEVIFKGGIDEQV